MLLLRDNQLGWTRTRANLGFYKHTSRKHALHKVLDVTKDNSEPIGGTLLARQRLDLNALDNWLGLSSPRGFENCSVGRKYFSDTKR